MARVDRSALRGEEGLPDEELVALALGAGPEAARAWLSARGRGDAGRTARRLERRFRAALALCERLRPGGEPDTICSAEDAVRLLGPRLRAREVEELHVVGLDPRNRVLGRAVIARGAVNQVMATAREVFRPLIAWGAARAIVAHNHPSGTSAPSEADAELTVRLAVAGELLGIALVDHLVIAQDGHHSFAAAPGGLFRKKRIAP